MALAELVPGTIFARDFVIHAPVARGGMGAVYRAEQRSTGNTVALKIMLPDLLVDAKSRDRFEREARVSSRIKSSHVVKVLAAGIDEPTQTPWLAMEFLDGQNLADYLTTRGPLAPDVVLAVLRQVGHALSAAHATGVVHCDLKPENIFIAPSQTEGVPFDVKVLDFGIARLVKEGRQSATVTTAVGSPHWLAPEQGIKGNTVSAATDVWSFGLIAFRLLTGRFYWITANVPDEAFNVYALLGELAGNDPIVSPSERLRSLGGSPALLPPGFDPWFSRCVNRNIGARFATVGDAVAGLGPALSPDRGVAATRVSAPSIPRGLSEPTSPSVQSQPPRGHPSGVGTQLIAERASPGPGPATFSRARNVVAAAGLGILATGAVLGVALKIAHVDPLDPVVDARQAPMRATTPPTTVVPRPPPEPAVEPGPAPVGPRSPPAPSSRGLNVPVPADALARRPVRPTRAPLPDVQGTPTPLSPVTFTPPPSPPPDGTFGVSGTVTARDAGPPQAATGYRLGDATEATGHMDPAAFRSVYNRYQAQIANCHSSASRNEAVSGVLVVRVRIGVDGSVRNTRIISDSAHSPALTRCVQTSVQSWRYPQPEGGEVEVDYPMRFGPATPPARPAPSRAGEF
ncbi:MAG: serine/threonine protein kinase [Myxococcaceae bacterium]|nr:serine/threonine protein kinase [Myxococcaceae bacterium]